MCDVLRRLLLLAGIIAISSVAASCARPVGDFGRASPAVLHDEVMPALGKARARAAGEPVSAFNLTDEEQQMHDRIWRFLIAPHARDWFMDTAVELQRTRLTGARTKPFEPARYYAWLQASDYRSSRVRYRTVADHARADIDTAPTTFAAICRVLEIDRQRGIASRELDLSGGDVAARRAENHAAISWFTRAIRYRHDAYAHALDRLLVETPHPEAVELDARIGELSIHVEAAERGDFCLHRAGLYDGGQKSLPARVHMHRTETGGYSK